METRTAADMIRDLLGVVRAQAPKICSTCSGHGKHAADCAEGALIDEAEAFLRGEGAIARVGASAGSTFAMAVAGLLFDIEQARMRMQARSQALPDGERGRSWPCGCENTYRDCDRAIRAALGSPSQITRIAAEAIALAPATSTRIADLTYGIRHLANCIDERSTPPADRRALFLKIARQAFACIEIGDRAPLKLAAPEIQPTDRQRFVARTHLSLLRGIANGAGHSRRGAAGVAPCIDAGLLEEDELDLAVLTAIGRRALTLETAAKEGTST